MTYNPGPRPRPPQWGNDGRSASANGFYANGHGPRNPPPRKPRYEDPYSPQDDYNGYSQNPWSNNANSYGGQYGDAVHSDREWNAQDEWSQQGGGSHKQNMRGYQEPRNNGRPQQRRPPEQGYSNGYGGRHDQPAHYDEGANYREWNEQDRGYRDPHTNHSGPPNGRGYENNMQQSYFSHSGGHAQENASYSAADNDQLPRYMNGHAHRFSNDTPRQRPDPQLWDRSQNARPPDRMPDQHKAPDAKAWDNPFPTFSPNSKQRRHGHSISSHSSRDKSSFDKGRPVNGPQSARLPSAADDRRPYQDISSRTYDGPIESGSAGRATKDQGYPGPSGYQHSRTMPAAIDEPTSDPGLIPIDNLALQEPAAVSGYYGPQGGLPAPGRPRAPSRTQSEDTRWGSKNAAKPVYTQDPYQQQYFPESRGEIVSSPQDEEPSTSAMNQQRRFPQRSPPAEDEMPNFDATQPNNRYGQDTSFDDHLRPHNHQQRHAHHPPHGNGYDRDEHYPEDIPRSRSQPDFNGPPRSASRPNDSQGPRSVPYERPSTSTGSRENRYHQGRHPGGYPNRSRGPDGSGRGGFGPGGGRGGADHATRDRFGGPREYDHSYPPNQHDRRPTPGQHRRPPNDPMQPPGPFRPPPRTNTGPPRGQSPTPDRIRSPHAQNGQPPPDRQISASAPPGAKHRGNLSLDKPLPNPDALPHHPAPVRPGLGASSSSGTNPRPPPVRQYGSPGPDPGVRSPHGKQGANQVTPQELEHLRQRTLKNPNDSATQFLLAQKLVEAADVLVDERADPASKKRNRDRYHADALKIIKKLSAISYPEADFFYADCYSRGGLGLPLDIKEAFLLYQKAAKANHAQAAYRVAVCCELGQEDGGGTKRDAVKAMQWYRRAATLGDVAAKYKMGVILLKGLLGQPRNPQEGLNWLRQAAEQADTENPHALHELALIHEKPTNIDPSIRQDEHQSRTLFTQAANLGYKFSQFRLGCAYEYGLLGCAVDPRQSIAWYSKAAVQEEHQSELALSGWYLTGAEGILQQSDTEAYLWARKAAQAGLAKAEYAMGYFTEVGIGAPANLEDAKRWYWKSASQNFPKARDRLEDLRRGGGPKQKTRVSRSNMRKQSDGECVVM